MAVALVTLLFTATGAAAQPQTVMAGGRTLHLKSQATRSELFGLVTLYDVALYAPIGRSSLDVLRDSATPKALRVDVEYDGSLPDRIPAGWRLELAPALTAQQTRTLRDAYARLGPKDSILIAYAPGRGTTVSVSGRDVLSSTEHDVVAAFLDIWLGQTPVSEEVKHELIKGL